MISQITALLLRGKSTPQQVCTLSLPLPTCIFWNSRCKPRLGEEANVVKFHSGSPNRLVWSERDREQYLLHGLHRTFLSLFSCSAGRSQKDSQKRVRFIFFKNFFLFSTDSSFCTIFDLLTSGYYIIPKPNNPLKNSCIRGTMQSFALPSNYYILCEESALPHLNLSWSGSHREADW